MQQLLSLPGIASASLQWHGFTNESRIPEVKVVLFIFDLFEAGETVKSITRTLNEKDIPPPSRPWKAKEAFWRESTVYSILTCRAYIGETIVNKTTRQRG